MVSPTELRLVVAEERPRTATPESLANVVFLCAEDDDVELLGIVQKARDKHLEVDVAAGVDRDVEALLGALPRRGVDAFMLFCSPRFPPADALGFRRQFEARFPGAQLIVVELDKSRADGLVDLLIRRLALARAQVGEPIAPIAPEPSVPVVAAPEPAAPPVVAAPEPTAPPVAAAPPVVAAPPVEAVVAPSSSKRGWIVGVVLLGVAAAAVFALMPDTTPSAGTETPPSVAAPVVEGASQAPVVTSAPVAPMPAPSADSPSNRERLQSLLGADHPALVDLGDVEADAAAMIIRAIESDDPCGAVAAGTAALRQVNPTLLALVVERAPQPTCAAPFAAPDTDAERVAVAKDRGRRRGRGKPGSPDAAPKADDAPAATPAAASSPAPRQAKLVDDDLLSPSR